MPIHCVPVDTESLETHARLEPDEASWFAQNSPVYDQWLSPKVLLLQHNRGHPSPKDHGKIEEAEFYGGRPKWFNWGETPTSNCFAGDSFSSLLIDVLQNRQVAPYIREIRHEGWFLCWESEVPDPSNQPHMHTPYTEKQFTLFKEALSQHVLPAKLETWIQELESGHEDPKRKKIGSISSPAS